MTRRQLLSGLGLLTIPTTQIAANQKSEGLDFNFLSLCQTFVSENYESEIKRIKTNLSSELFTNDGQHIQIPLDDWTLFEPNYFYHLQLMTKGHPEILESDKNKQIEANVVYGPHENKPLRMSERQYNRLLFHYRDYLSQFGKWTKLAVGVNKTFKPVHIRYNGISHVIFNKRMISVIRYN